MKTFLSIAILCCGLLSFSTSSATAPQADMIAEAPYAWDIACADFDCPISGERVLRQVYGVEDCKSVSEERIKAAANDIADRFCAKFKECCIANGCDEGSCRLVSYRYDCLSENRLVIYVKVEFKCG